jgi:16S rRNA G966 N2-methylase RsmD
LHLTEHIRHKLKIDFTATYQATNEEQADEITSILSDLPGIDSSSVVVDATACIGGNTLSFAKHFEEVVAIELDEGRYKMLQHNTGVLEEQRGSANNNTPTRKRKRGKVTCMQGDCLTLIPELRQDNSLTVDAVFLDPPWGAHLAKETTSVDLHLGKLTLSEVCKQLVQLLVPELKYVLIKIPANFGMADLRAVCENLGVGLESKIISNRVRLLVIDTRGRSQGAQGSQGAPQKHPAPAAAKHCKKSAKLQTTTIRVKKR